VYASFWNVDAGARVTGNANLPGSFGPVTAVFADPARPILVFQRKDGSYFAWNFQTHKTLRGVAGTCSDKNERFVFDPTGTRLFVYCSDVSIFSLDTGKVVRVTGKVDRFALSPSGQQFVIVSDDRTVTVMDGTKATVLAKWRQADQILGLAMSYDDRTVLTQDYDGIQFRSSKTGAVSQPPLKTSQARTFDFQLSGTDNILVTDGDDGRMVWNVGRAAPIQQLEGDAEGFLPNGILVSTDGPKITLWEYPTEGHTGANFAVDRADLYVANGHRLLCSSVDGKKIITLTDGGDLYIWSSDPAMLLHAVTDEGEKLGSPATFSGNGKIIVTSSKSSITVWDAATLTATNHIQLDLPPARLDASGDGRRLVYINSKSNYDILDAGTLRSIKPAGLPSSVYAAALSADGEAVALGYKKSISLWRVADGSNLNKCDTNYVVGNVIWTDNGMIAYAMDDGTVAILMPDTCSSKQIFSFTVAQPSDEPSDADLRSEQGLILANLSNRVQVWSESQSKQIFDATRDNWPVFDESFSESTIFNILAGHRIIVGKQPDRNLHIYDLATKNEILSFKVSMAETNCAK
jgi:WD40 repeat protein